MHSRLKSVRPVDPFERHCQIRKHALPGATVTVVNLSSSQKIETSSDVTGSFEVTVPSDGQYSVSAHMAAFAPLTREVQIGDANRNAQVVLELILESRARQGQTEQTNLAIYSMDIRGLQAIVAGSEARRASL